MDINELIGHSFMLVPIALCGIISATVAFERVYYLYFHASIASGEFMETIRQYVMAGRIDKAIAHCTSAPRAPLANVVRAALTYADAGRDETLLAVEHASLDATPDIQKRVSWLATLANVATLLGLLGTIVGLIRSFGAVAQANPEEKQQLLATGISLAMYATAGGLTVAIPSLLWHAFLVQRANAILDDVDRYGMQMVLLLDAWRGAKKKDEAQAPANAG